MFQSRALRDLESQLATPQFRADRMKLRDYYRQLLRQGEYRTVIQRYEQQPQLPMSGREGTDEERSRQAAELQRDPELARLYATALLKEGRVDLLADRLATLVGAEAPRQKVTEAAFAIPSSSKDSLVSEGKDFTVRTNPSEWQRRMDKTRNAKDSKDEDHPIHVVVSEAFSWTKLSRKLFSTLFGGLLIVTSFAVLMDQQASIRPGGLTASGDVEPSTTTQTVRFGDVQGVDEAKHELEEIVAFLKHPNKFMELGGKLPKGVLLYGPPGTGKTHLARAVAGEAGVPFFQISGSEFDELYVGVGARRVRELFAAAKKKAPCIIFIDELDAVGSKRSMKDQSYMRQTLNQLLVELDGFGNAQGIVVIGATNTAESLDKALVRPGRFDRLVSVPLPDVRGRSQILKVHMKGVKVAPAVRPDVIARGTPGFSGADLANLVNQAAIKASKDGAKAVSMEDLEWAKDKIIMGSEKKSAVITEKDKRITAYHEGGHTLVAIYTEGAMPIHKVTVIPRGNALGLTVQLPEDDRSHQTKSELFAMLDVCMGGRVAEELIFGPKEVTTGASSDLQKATSIARSMVMAFGMSEKVGLLNFSNETFEKASSQTKALIESEINALLEVLYLFFVFYYYYFLTFGIFGRNRIKELKHCLNLKRRSFIG